MERKPFWGKIEREIRRWRELSSLNKDKKLMANLLINVLPKSYLQGKLEGNTKVDDYMNKVDDVTKLQHKTLLARAYSDLQSNSGVISYSCLPLDKSDPLVHVETKPQDNGTILQIILNANHDAFSFKRSQGGISLDVATALEILKALIQAEVIRESQSQTYFLPRND